MGRIPTFRETIDSTKQISISDLKKWGYLDSPFKTGTLTWNVGGRQTGSMGISVINGDNTRLILDYKYGEEKRNYIIPIVFIPSNLSKGVTPYFLCPQTNKKARILYGVDGWFFHRSAFKRMYYESQKQSKQMRLLDKTLGLVFIVDEYYAELYSKGFKSTYKGKPTKRYLWLSKKIREAKEIDLKIIKDFFC